MDIRPNASIAIRLQLRLLAVLLALAAAAAGCQGSATSSGTLQQASAPAPLAVIGTFTDEFGANHVITATQWTTSDSFGTATYAILSYDNANAFLIAQNGASNSFFPNLYSRFDWTTVAGDLYVCQSVYNGADVAAAQAGVADRTAPAAGGCGLPANSFPWTNLTPPPGP